MTFLLHPLHQHGRGQRRLCPGAGQGLCVWRVPGAAGWRAGACVVSRTSGGGEVRVLAHKRVLKPGMLRPCGPCVPAHLLQAAYCRRQLSQLAHLVLREHARPVRWCASLPKRDATLSFSVALDDTRRHNRPKCCAKFGSVQQRHLPPTTPRSQNFWKGPFQTWTAVCTECRWCREIVTVSLW